MNLSLMAPGALKVVRTCAAVRPGEHVVILTDVAVPHRVEEELAFAATAEGGSVVTVTMPRPRQPGEEPPPLVAEAMKRAHVILAPTSLSVFHTAAARDAVAAGARMLAISECREETLIRGGIDADFAARAPVAEALARRLGGDRLELRTPGGTDLAIRLGGPAAVANTGLATRPGTRARNPTNQAYVAPLERAGARVALV